MLLCFSVQQLGNGVQQAGRHVRRGMGAASARLAFRGQREKQDG